MVLRRSSQVWLNWCVLVLSFEHRISGFVFSPRLCNWGIFQTKGTSASQAEASQAEASCPLSFSDPPHTPNTHHWRNLVFSAGIRARCLTDERTERVSSLCPSTVVQQFSMWSEIIHLNSKKKKKPFRSSCNLQIRHPPCQRHQFEKFKSGLKKKNHKQFSEKLKVRAEWSECAAHKGNNQCLNASVGEMSRK